MNMNRRIRIGRRILAQVQINDTVQRRYALKAGSVFKLIGLAVILVLATLVGSAMQAQPMWLPPSGCKESAVLTTERLFNPGTGAFTLDRTIIPGVDEKVVLGAWAIVDGFIGDPAAGAPATPNCQASPGDGNPTYVTLLRVKPISGDPVAVGIQEVEIWLDNDVDGFLSEGKDTQLATLPGACLTAPEGCEVTFGNAPILNGVGFGPGLADNIGGAPIPGMNCTAPGGGPSCVGVIVVGKIENPQPGATLQVALEAQASDLPNFNPGAGPGAFSSGFAPGRERATSNVRVVVQGVPGAPGVLSPSVNNGSGNPETGILGINLLGIRTKTDRGGLAGTLERDARPGDREYVVGLIALCDNGDLVTPQVTLLPAVAGATPAIAGGLAAIPCVTTTAGTDNLNTNILRVRVGVSGPGAQYVQAVHLYADDCFNTVDCGWALPAVGNGGFLFEQGELIGSAIPVNGVAVFGSLEQVLTTSGGLNLVLGSNTGFPALLYVTVDISDQARASEVVLQVAVDVGDVILGFGGAGFGGPSSNLIRTQPQEFRFQISGPEAPPSPGGVSQFDTNGNNVIDDAEFFNAIDQWVNGQITDTLFFSVLDHWIAQTPISTSGLTAQAVSVALAQSAHGLTLSVGGPGVTSVGLWVYDLNGRTVFRQEVVGTTLSWSYLSSEGTPVANGVYLYVVTVKDAQGRTLISSVRKLVIVR